MGLWAFALKLDLTLAREASATTCQDAWATPVLGLWLCTWGSG